MGVLKFWTQRLFIFDLLELISDEWKSTCSKHNFMIFLNMDSEIVYLGLFDSSEGIFERPKNWFEYGE